ncbi:Gfo/Idh/MocA family protein [Zafaria sp. J156]|uniref:Gfo/Idh/MocA family protein n=1 Tax=Zafaria sp. J156 TaxID=3116490 RepID=UPI002E78EC6E|nr:Gfo/Idh/MocA family oxidoreductase [Zafaria sp. J156]MEE1622565.1 Gfo/Idh/MocA family oxidoreductase [Zafaria sp. J156]
MNAQDTAASAPAAAPATQRTGPVGVGIIGAGVISTQYLDNLTTFADVVVHAIGDLFPEAAKARAEQYGIAVHGTPEDVLSHPEVEIVVNLTIPAAHVPVAQSAVRAGKHVWSEKPFSLDRASGRELLAEAEAAGLLLGCAPDTFLGAGLQSARRAIEAGVIGAPLTALTLFHVPGPEAWHPSPEFLFQAGAGPLLDMGPYYLTALIQTFGSIRRVAAMGTRSRDQRTIATGPKAGTAFDVTVPTHVGALIEFESGQQAQSIFSFQSELKRMGWIEMSGTEGTLSLPDPNMFDGELRLMRAGADEWEVLELEGSTAGRGQGVLDMARAIRAGRAHRAQGALAFHVVDALLAIEQSAATGEFVAVESSAPVVPALPAEWDPAAATL